MKKSEALSSGRVKNTAKYNRYFSHADEVILVNSGDDFFQKAVALIKKSTQTLHFQTYIFTYDSTGKIIINELIDAAKRGVTVYLLVDAFGSNELGPVAIRQLTENGIQFRKFSPLFSHYRIRFGRRLHHKIILADEKEALIGGINVEDKYRVEGPETPWLDFAVLVTGEVCKDIWIICQSLWLGKGFGRNRKKMLDGIGRTVSHKNIPVKISENDWLRRKDKISKGLRGAIKHSHVSITIVASYFLPGTQLRKLIKKAADRGVFVTIILPGISDVQLAKKATKYLYAWMLRNNIAIYEWNKTILHGKINLVDDKWASIGSYNINHLSRYSSIETNIEVFDAHFCHVVKQQLDDIKAQCHQVTVSEYNERMNIWQKFICWCAFYFTRFLFLLEFAVLSNE